MSQPILNAQYQRSEAIAACGLSAQAKSLCDGQWVVGPDVIACFALLGKPPKNPHFANAVRFIWSTQKDYKINDDSRVGFLPVEVAERCVNPRPIHLFVKGGTMEAYLYAGVMVPPLGFRRIGWRGAYGMAEFTLRQAVSSDVLLRLDAIRLGDTARVDVALARLNGPLDAAARFEVLKEVVEYWHGPIEAVDGIPESELAGIRMPEVLKWWYLWAGRREEIMSGQDHLEDPARLSVNDGGLLTFHVENQGMCLWMTSADGVDPEVIAKHDGSVDGVDDPLIPEGMTVSEHLILSCLQEATLRAPYRVIVPTVEVQEFCTIVERIPPIAIKPRSWPHPTQLYAKAGAFMFATVCPPASPRKKSTYQLLVGAQTQEPLQFLKPLVCGNDEDVVSL